MVIAACFALGLFTNLWPLPIIGGLVGEIANYASSPLYRRQMRTVPHARTAAILSALTLSAICVGVFWIGYGVRLLLG